MEIKESSKKFYRVNYGREMPEDAEQVVNNALSCAKWFDNYVDAIKGTSDANVLDIETNEILEVYDVAMAPPDYGEKRYCANTDTEFLTIIAGFKFIDQHGNPLQMATVEGYEHKKYVW